MKPKDQEKAEPGKKSDDRRTVDDEKLDSVSGAGVPVSIELGGAATQPPNQAPQGNR